MRIHTIGALSSHRVKKKRKRQHKKKYNKRDDRVKYRGQGK